jgi:hypothetical protein
MAFSVAVWRLATQSRTVVDAALFEQIRAAAKGLLATRKKGDNVDAFAKLLAENAGEMKVAKVVTGLGPAPQAKANL